MNIRKCDRCENTATKSVGGLLLCEEHALEIRVKRERKVREEEEHRQRRWEEEEREEQRTKEEARRGRRPSIFACYSRTNRDLVIEILKLYEVSRAIVFRDEVSIELGQGWRAAIDNAIANCDTCLTFWSEGASRSAEVRREYLKALSLGKLVYCNKQPVQIEYNSKSTSLLDYSDYGSPCSHCFIPRRTRRV